MKQLDFKKSVDNMAPNELKLKSVELTRKIAQTRLTTKVGKNKNLREVFNLRHQLAVVLTKLNQTV